MSETKPQDPRTIDYLKKLLEDEKTALECNLQQEKNKQKEINEKTTPENPTVHTTETNEGTTKEKEITPIKSDAWSAGNLLGSLTKELNKTKQKYSKQVWDQDELQQDLQCLTTHQKEILSILANKPKNLTPEQSVQAEELKKFNKRLTRNISSLKQKYTENSSVVASRLMAEKDVIKNKLKSRTGIEEVVLQLYQQVEFLKYRLNNEIKQRCELEILLDVEVNELNNLLLLESNSREELRVQLDQAMRIRNSVLGDLQLLKGKLELILDEHECYLAQQQEEKMSSNTSVELLDLISMTQEIDNKLSAIGELVDPGDLEIISHSDSHTKLVEKLAQQAAEESSIRKLMQDKNSHLETQIRQLERQLLDERTARQNLEKQFEKEITELRNKYDNSSS